MYEIKNAKLTRMTEYNGKPCAEIEINLASQHQPGLLAFIARTPDGQDFEIIRMVRNESDLAIDWYNNNLHNAYEEIAEENFGDAGELDAPLQREQFRKSLLQSGSILTQLEQALPAEG
ncbi:hypothetical protein [Paenibacillus sp. J22TS3]|uniref:hypothetical protein n=1 Tax=Paenibacillus sp. J22TS3 TaxID=2807192 RepID=UPI001B0B2997|nr:hypothetical protein [Paenibacillus sp. J22TS3]GIP22460.1 hypothetical protein J22TS3_27350 [Paenibacillus sp. J22TS3]